MLGVALRCRGYHLLRPFYRQCSWVKKNMVWNLSWESRSGSGEGQGKKSCLAHIVELISIQIPLLIHKRYPLCFIPKIRVLLAEVILVLLFYVEFE